MPDSNVVRTITIRGQTDGIDQAVSSLKSFTDTQQKAIVVTDQLRIAVDRAAQSLNTNVQNLNQLKSANDNVSSGYADMAAKARDFTGSIAQTAENVLNTVNHLKLLALAAYALSPAFRTIANAGIGGIFSLLQTGSAKAAEGIEKLAAKSPLAAAALRSIQSAGAAAGSAVASFGLRALSFFGSITAPIAAAVISWKALNYVWEQGSELLDKYGNAQRNLYAANTDANLAKLTTYQQDTIDANQVQIATELGARMRDAKFAISEFAKVQLDLTGPALALQRVWVNILEVIAEAARQAQKIIDKASESPWWGRVGRAALNTVPLVGPAINLGVAATNYLSPPKDVDPLPAARNQLAGGLIKGMMDDTLPYGAAEMKSSDADQLRKDRKAYAATHTFRGRFSGDITSLTDTKPDEPAKDDAYDRALAGVQNQVDMLKLEADGASKTSQAVEELRVQHTMLAAASKANIKPTDDMRAEWKTLADQIADYTIKVNQAKVAQEETFKSQTMFMSPSDSAAATAAHQIDPTNWQAHLGDAGPKLAAVNTQLSTARDTALSFTDAITTGFARGASAAQVLQTALSGLENSLIQMLDKQIINGLFASATPGTPGQGNTIGSFFASLFGGTGTTPFYPTPTGAPVPSANGNVFSGGNIIPFARGGIVSSPTLFPMANGAGLMGEAGPEAVMPLRRGSDGRLGVSGGGSNVNVTVVNQHAGASVDVQQRKGANGQVDIVATVKKIVNSHINDGGADKPMGRFGLKPLPR